jgi:hypothetical protein
MAATSEGGPPMVKRCIVYSPTGSILLNDAPEEVFIAFESWLKGGSPAYWVGEHNAKPVALNFQQVSCVVVYQVPTGTNYPT